MAEINDLEISDIRKFLQENGIYGFGSINNPDMYSLAFDLMKKSDTSYNDVPISIKEWVLAYNALHKKINIPSYTKNHKFKS